MTTYHLLRTNLPIFLDVPEAECTAETILSTIFVIRYIKLMANLMVDVTA